MDLMAWLQIPATLLLILAAVLLLVALAQGFACRRHFRRGRRLAGSWRLLMLLVFSGLTVLCAGAGMALRGYHVLGSETPVLDIRAQQLGPQSWALALQWPDGRHEQVTVQGDAWRVEAVVLKWKLPTVLAGVPPLYRLDRLSGRYDDPHQAQAAPHTVVNLDDADTPDLFSLRHKYPQWLPMVDTVYGSGAWLPLVNQREYRVSLMRTGALVARPVSADAHPIGEG